MVKVHSSATDSSREGFLEAGGLCTVITGNISTAKSGPPLLAVVAAAQHCTIVHEVGEDLAEYLAGGVPVATSVHLPGQLLLGGGWGHRAHSCGEGETQHASFYQDELFQKLYNLERLFETYSKVEWIFINTSAYKYNLVCKCYFDKKHIL